MRFRDFDAVLFDMDGTLYHASEPAPGAAEVLAHLQQQGIPAACLTNNSASTAQELSDRLAGMGMTVAPDMIWSAADAMAGWIAERFDRPRVFNFTGNALPQLLADKAQFVETDDAACDVVAIGVHSCNYGGVEMDLNRAVIGMRLLRRGAELIVGCADRIFPSPQGAEFGSGSLAMLFANAAALPSKRIHYAGKPEHPFFEQLCRRLNVSPGRCLLVGDNLESDIRGGHAVGMTTALVLTGVSRREEIGEVQPNLVFEDMPQLLAAMR